MAEIKFKKRGTLGAWDVLLDGEHIGHITKVYAWGYRDNCGWLPKAPTGQRPRFEAATRRSAAEWLVRQAEREPAEGKAS